MTAPRRQNVSPRAKELIMQIYSHHGAGCCWHVVLDDDNWDSIEFCRDYARKAVAVKEYSDTGEEPECITEGACRELANLDITASILSRARDAAFRKMRNSLESAAE